MGLTHMLAVIAWRTVATTSLSFFLTLNLAWTNAVAATPNIVSLKAGIPAYYEGFLPVYAALEKGYFAEEGLKVEVITFKGGGAAGQAFVAGSIDLCLCSFDHVLKLQSKGLDAVAIGGIEEYNAYALIAKEGQLPGGIAGLRGKKVGITTPGSATDITMRYEIKKAGLDIRDVTLVSIGSATAIRAALENGQIDAGMVIGGTLVDMLSRGGWDIVVDFRTQRYPLEVVSAKRAWLKENADVARRFLRALVRAQALVQNDAEAAYQVTKMMFPRMDERIVRGISEAAIRRLSPDGSINEQGVAAITQHQIFAGTIPKPIPYASLVDLSYLPARPKR